MLDLLVDEEGVSEDDDSKLGEAVGCGDWEWVSEALSESEGLPEVIGDAVCTAVFVPRGVKLGLCVADDDDSATVRELKGDADKRGEGEAESEELALRVGTLPLLLGE